MRLILLSGGQGSRLWPLSYPGRTKPFIPITGSGGVRQSAIQRIWEQLRRLGGLDRRACVVIGPGEERVLLEQLGDDVPYLVEPEGRGTYPAFVHAAARLSVDAREDETLVALPADLDAGDDFFEMLWSLEAALNASGAALALIGTRPAEPSAQFGYIEAGRPVRSGGQQWMPVERFVEKPSIGEAAELIAAGAWWNCGVAAVRRSTLAQLLRQDGLTLEKAATAGCFRELEPTSLDYKLLQHSNHIVMLPFEGAWRDLGSWSAWLQAVREHNGAATRERNGERASPPEPVDVAPAIHERNGEPALSPDPVVTPATRERNEETASPREQDCITALPREQDGGAVLYDGEMAVILNETEMEVRVEGMMDVLVVVSPAGILVKKYRQP